MTGADIAAMVLRAESAGNRSLTFVVYRAREPGSYVTILPGVPARVGGTECAGGRVRVVALASVAHVRRWCERRGLLP